MVSIQQAWDVVGDDAIVAAADILERMCKHTPADVIQRMVDAGCDVAIIGRNQASCLHTCGAYPSARADFVCCTSGGRVFVGMRSRSIPTMHLEPQLLHEHFLTMDRLHQTSRRTPV